MLRIDCSLVAGSRTGMPQIFLTALLLVVVAARAVAVVNVLVEAESFTVKGGWRVAPQFMQQMGSPIVLAHGGGRPVSDATSEVAFPEPGTYHVWVRTRDWVPTHTDKPGQFKPRVNGVELTPIFGTQSVAWQWQDGGTVALSGTNATVALHDLTGFDGRCDAVAFISGSDTPPPDAGLALATWRASLTGEASDPPQTNRFDCVVVGGGMAGCCASLAAARSGLRVALSPRWEIMAGRRPWFLPRSYTATWAWLHSGSKSS